MKAGTGRLVTLAEPRSPAAEAYRTLRANIQFSSPDSPLRTLLVTSPGADEGKSIVLCNLAVAIAQTGTRVTVVDSDLRKPSVHTIFDLANDKGLTTALLDERGEDVPLQPTAVPGLQVLAAGPQVPNPGDLLGTPRMERIVESLAASAEFVLFDGPPVIFVMDAAVLASKLDGAILVVSAGRTRRDAADRARAILEKARARILGVVLNNAGLDSRLQRYCDDRRK